MDRTIERATTDKLPPGPEAVAAAADGLHSTLGFERWRTTRAEELSGGTRSKLNLAVALLADPEVLLLDEPYAGFDFDTYERFWDLTAELRAGVRVGPDDG